LRLRDALLCLAMAAALPGTVNACTAPNRPSSAELVHQADGIYRVRAVQYAMHRPPKPPVLPFMGPESHISFRVLEVLKGPARRNVDLAGVFTGKHDHQRDKVPYEWVRASGESGGCYAREYLQGQEYLLIMKGGTAYWSPLSPTNEEVAGASDPWVEWVRDKLHAPATIAATPADSFAPGETWGFVITDTGRASKTATFVVETSQARSCLGGDWRRLRQLGGDYEGVSEPAWRVEGKHVWVLLASDVCDRYDQLEGVLAKGKFSGRHSLFGIEGSDDLGTFSATRASH